MSRVMVLDVGHGNSSVITSNNETAVVDSPVGGFLIETLKELGIKEVEAAFISHSDSDHISGILALITSPEITVKTVYVNPDASKKTKVWRDFRAAVFVAETQGTCSIQTSLTTTAPSSVAIGDVSIQVISPSAAMAISGVSGDTLEDRKITPNGMSAVLKVSKANGISVLLAGDLDDVGLQDILKRSADMKSTVLVYPHHGGLPSSANAEAFIDSLTECVDPDFVVISNGRGKYDNPNPLIMEKLVQRCKSIACTQLSERCHAKSPYTEYEHLEDLPSMGRNKNTACAGSISIDLSSDKIRILKYAHAHAEFVANIVTTPMCAPKN